MSQRGVFYGWVVLAAAATVIAVGMGALFSLAVFLKPIEDSMHWSRSAISLVALINWIAMGVGSFVWGALSDHAAADPVGPRPPHERADPHRDPVDQRDQRDGAPAPVHRVLDGLEEDGEREEGAHAHGDHGGGGREDDPAVEDSALTHGRGLR